MIAGQLDQFHRRGTHCLFSVFALLCLSWPTHAANLTTSSSQVGGQDWSAAIWKTNGSGVAVSPTHGNTYECVSNGIAFGSSVGNTRLRALRRDS